MTSVLNPIPPQNLSGIIGHRFIYTYANGWQYEMYVKNETTIDYRIHSGHVGGRWVKRSGEPWRVRPRRDENRCAPVAF